jgi:hypothetical protein
LSKVFSIFHEPIKNKEAFLQNSLKYFNDSSLGENACKQTIMKGMFSRFSTKKEDMVVVLREN